MPTNLSHMFLLEINSWDVSSAGYKFLSISGVNQLLEVGTGVPISENYLTLFCEGSKTYVNGWEFIWPPLDNAGITNNRILKIYDTIFPKIVLVLILKFELIWRQNDVKIVKISNTVSSIVSLTLVIYSVCSCMWRSESIQGIDKAVLVCGGRILVPKNNYKNARNFFNPVNAGGK